MDFYFFAAVSIFVCASVRHHFAGSRSRSRPGSNWCLCFRPRTSSPTSRVLPPYRTPPNTRVTRPSITLERLSPGTSPPPMSDRELSPSKTLESFGMFGQTSGARLSSARQSNASAESFRKARETFDCWHECIRLYGYISCAALEREGIPITDGVSVVVEGRPHPICDCRLSQELVTVLQHVQLDVATFDAKRRKDNKRDLKKFIKPAGLCYFTYEEFHRDVKKSLKRNDVPLDADEAWLRHKDSPC